MSIHDFSSQRLYVDATLAPGGEVLCTPDQINYLKNVLRLTSGATVFVFNGRHGEWQAELAARGKRDFVLQIKSMVRPQVNGPDIDYLFAPLKKARTDYMVQKATEMGVSRLQPVLTRHTIAERVNLDRMRANVIEAAEQCGVLRVPEVLEPVKLERCLAGWDASRRLIFCDEAAPLGNPLDSLRGLESGPLAVLIGPEGGFSVEERALLLGKSYTIPVSLGPRIMRSDTAAVAALTVVNCALGDWHA
jgi:16S rRNA (uracil1498-N3)-methyltransferase